MSEQSGPITREQVERAIAKPRNIDYRELPLGWRELAPDYVIAAEAADDWDAEHAALTRWRDELAAAERSHGKVARWDAARGAYVALDDHGTVCMITPDRETAIGWGYGVAPAEDSPERLRERREALGLSTEQAADLIKDGWCDEDIARCEDPRSVCDPRARTRYAAALSAEEVRRAAVGAWAANGGVLHYSPPAEPERPAPRFKVGDRVTSGMGGPWKIGRVEWGRLVPEADCDEWVYHHASGNVSACESVLALAWTPTPASPPAPEVVDVPQPLVKRCGGVEAQWDLGEDHVTLVEPARGVGLPAPLALLRAMLAAIDAQQGGAS